ncbi:tropomyosin like-domain-containing protein [Butyriboletus roseoflavus]|nr:tropomyosin like-domain-containing protein [Butyriboletus roseoflavus]
MGSSGGIKWMSGNANEYCFFLTLLRDRSSHLKLLVTCQDRPSEAPDMITKGKVAFRTAAEHVYLIASSPNVDLNRSLPSDIIINKTLCSARQYNGKDQRGISSLVLSALAHRTVQKMNAIRAEADNAVTRAEVAEVKNKQLEQQLLEKEQNITSLNVQIARIEKELEATEEKLTQAKSAQEDGEHSKTTNDSLARKIVLLEEELDAAEKNVKETTEKLRQVDVKAEHFERQVQRAEQERDQWEQKYEEILAKYKASQAELDELMKSMEGI